jgi:hypothetical protein
LDEGAVTGKPVETEFGVHVIQLHRKIAGAQLPFDIVRENIRRYLEQRAQRDAHYSYVRWLSLQARISGFNLETGEMDPAVTAAGLDRNAAMKRFAAGASAEDWTKLMSVAQNASDPAKACDDAVQDWKPAAAPGSAARAVFTLNGKVQSPSGHL